MYSVKIKNDKFSATESFDPFAVHVNISDEITNIEQKTVITDNDSFIIEDSEDIDNKTLTFEQV
jgi:hypothetical protein